MSTVIKLKYSQGTAQPADDLLQIAEPAYSFVGGGKLYIGADDAGTVVPHVVGGKYFTDLLDHTAGTLTASSAIIVDSNSKIDVLNVDNLTLDGNTISSTNLNGNIVLDPNGSGEIQLSANTTVGGDLTVTGSIDLAGVTVESLLVEDLTAGRVVLAGVGGEIEDSGNLTFNGTTLTVNGVLDVDGVRVDGTTIAVTTGDADLNLTSNGTGVVRVTTNTGFGVASGVAGTRPTAISVGDGVIRYNETDGRFEGTVNGNWTGLGGVVDVDQDTYITAEESADEDVLRFYTAGVEQLTVSGSGIVVNNSVGVTANGGIDVDNINIDGDTITINGSTIQGSGNASAGTITLDPAPAAGDNGGELIIRGNLQVTGTTTTVNSTVVEISDPVIVLGEDGTTDSLDRGISVKYNDGAAKAGFIGWDRGAENNFTFVPNTATGDSGDARFGNLKLEGAIVEYDGATPSNGQLLIGTGSDLTLATLTGGNSITVTNGSGSISIAVDASSDFGTTDPAGGDYTPNGSNVAARGASSFASEQFNVSSGHVYITTIDGGTF